MKYLFYILFVFVCLCSVCGEIFIKNKKINTLCFFVPLLAFFVLAILRGNSVGIDTSNYRSTYDSMRSMSFSEAMKGKFPEVGFYGIQYIMSGVIKLPSIAADVFNYLLICVLLSIAFFKSKHRTMMVSLFLFVGFFCMSFSGIRQAISISIITVAFSYYIHTRQSNIFIKLIIYYLLVAVATSFHTAALIAALAPVVFALSFEKYQTPFIPIFILLFLPLLLSRVFIVVSDLMAATSSNREITDSRVSITLIAEVIFVAIFYFLFFTKIGDKIREKIHMGKYEFKDEDSDYLWLIVLGCFWMSFNQSTTILTRFSMFFYMSIPYFLTQIADTFENKKAKNIFMIVATLLVGLYFVYSTPTLGLTPYVFR